MEQIILQLNNNRILGAVTMLTMNICGKYFMSEFPTSIDRIAKNNIMRLFILFSFCFIATRHILYSILFVIIILILTKYLLNDNSISCVLKQQKEENNISEEDYKKALQIIQNYDNKKNK